jgi:FkbM family methyltransferase
LLLGREANPEEWPGHSARAGEKLSSVVRTFLHSKEFQDRRLMESGHLGSYQLARVGGLVVAASPEDIDVGKHVLGGGQYEPHVTSVFQRELKEGMHILDVGANCGYFSFLALSLVGSQGHVWAIEPNPSNVRLLEIGKRLNSVSNLTIVAAAAGATFGTARLNAGQSNGTVSPLPQAVQEVWTSSLVCQLALDTLFEPAKRLDVVKIDVEGAEYVALKGLERTLERLRPKIVSEFSPRTMPGISGVTGTDYLEFLLRRDYRIGVISGDGQVDRYYRAAAPILEAFQRSAVDHIDFLALPA